MMGTWIFQGSPDKFDIEGYLAVGLPKISWMVTRYADQIKPGDRVYIWQAAGKKKATSGILASATVISEVWSGPNDEAAIPFWKVDGAALREAARVSLRVEKVANGKEVIKRDWLSQDPICNDLLIIRQSAGTNYPLSPVHADRIGALWSKTGVTWSRAEAIAALRVYEQTYGKPISKRAGSPVAELAVQCGRAIGGAYNKVLNFRAIDPRDERAGLPGAGDGDRLVWAEFYEPLSRSIDVQRLNEAYSKFWVNAWVKPTSSEQFHDLEAKVVTAMGEDLSSLEERLKKTQGNKPPRSATTTTTVYERSPDVIAYAKKRAGLRCEVPGCDHTQFFKPNGDAYIEVHHIATLAEGGLDTVYNVACLCPAHHREIHFGTKASELQSALQRLRSN